MTFQRLSGVRDVAKLLGASVPLGQVVLLRFAIQALILIPIVWYSGRIWRMRGRVLIISLWIL